MKRHHILIGLLFAFTLYIPAWGQANEAVNTLKRQQAKIEQLSLTYAEIIARNPGNKGAKKLDTQLRQTLQSIDRYLAGERESANVKYTAQQALTEARRYSTDRAKEAQETLRDIVKLTDKLPRKLTLEQPSTSRPRPTASTEPNTDEEPLVTDTSPQLDNPVEAEAPTTVRALGNAQPMDYELFYWLFGAFLLALIAVAAALFTQQRKLANGLEGRITGLSERLENLEYVTGSSNDFKGVKLGEVKGQVDQLEQNMADFLERVERRMSDTQNLVDRLTTTSRERQAREEALEAQVGALEALKTRISTLEAGGGVSAALPSSARSSTEGGSRIQPTLAEDLLAMVQQYRAATSRETFQKRLAESETDLQAALTSQRLDEDALVRLARTLQLAHVTALEDQQSDAYTALKALCADLNITVEDQMTGRMAFSDFYAENLTLDAYAEDPKMRSDLYPEFERTKAAVLSSSLMQDAVANTVLAVLSPAVTWLHDGSKKVLRRGEYLVKGSAD